MTLETSKKYTTLTCILFLNIFAFPQHKVSRIKTICPTTQKYYAKLCLGRIMLICFDEFFFFVNLNPLNQSDPYLRVELTSFLIKLNQSDFYL